jgi:hypothetical protein
MSEHTEQVAVIQWSQYAICQEPALRWLYAVPNGTRTSFGVANKMTAEGVKKGVPDLCLPVPRRGFHGLYIEMKTIYASGKKGNVKPEQQAWINELLGMGYYADVCYSADEAIDRLKWYLDLR